MPKKHEAEKVLNQKCKATDETLSNYGEYHIECLEVEGRSLTTLAGYKNILNHIKKSNLGKIKLSKLDIRHINQYKLWISKNTNLQKVTINKHLRLLQGILERALDEHYIRTNPITKRAFIKLEAKEEQKVYNQEQCALLLKRVRGTTLEIPVTIAVYTGMRRGEIEALRWQNVDLEERTIYVRENRVRAGKCTYIKEPKSKESIRYIGISGYLLEVLKKEKLRQEENKEIFKEKYYDNGYIHCKDNGELYAADYISKEFSKFIKKSGLPYIRFHDLRHTFITLALKSGKLNIKQIQGVAGHSEARTTTEIYMHVESEDNKEVVEAVEGMIKLDYLEEDEK